MSNQPTIFAHCADGLPLGLGGAPIGNLLRPLPEGDVGNLIETALAGGCRTFDTAPHYGHGLSERRFGHYLRPAPRDSLTISSKVGRLLTPDPNASRAQHSYFDIPPFNQHWDYSARGVRRSVEDSLQRLGLARLNAVFVHDCDQINHGDNYRNVIEQVVTETIPELQKMKREGLLSAIGLGVNGTEVCLDVLKRADLDCLLLAGRYTLLDQAGLTELLPLCVKRGVRVAIGGVFNSGILATGVRAARERPIFNYALAEQQWIDRAGRIEKICDDFAVPLRAAALQFPMAHPAVEIVLVGAQHPDHWTGAVAMARHGIPVAFWQALRQAKLLPDNAPLPEATA